ncbi:hypothetical protein CR513_39656, partial [Mucuna pruriens]
MDCYRRVSEVEREPIIEYTTERPMITNYAPNRGFNEKIVYEDVIGGSNHHHHHMHHPETRERVKVVQYEQVPERRVYEEKIFRNHCQHKDGRSSSPMPRFTIVVITKVYYSCVSSLQIKHIIISEI